MKPQLIDIELETTPIARQYIGDDGVVAETHIDGFRYKLKARQVEGILFKVGDEIKHSQAVVLHVTQVKIEHCCGSDKVFIEAEGRTPDKCQEKLKNIVASWKHDRRT